MLTNPNNMRLLPLLILIGMIVCVVGAKSPSTEQIPINTRFVAATLRIEGAMLVLVYVGHTDTLYDLGCGDGCIVISAARKYGARSVGIDIKPARIDEARANASSAGVTDRVTF